MIHIYGERRLDLWDGAFGETTEGIGTSALYVSIPLDLVCLQSEFFRSRYL